jgi:hypothetical protein
MTTNEMFIETMKAKVVAWKADVDRLQAKAERIDNVDMGPYSACIQKIIANIQRFENQFAADSGSGADTWQVLRKQAEAVGKEIDMLIEQAHQRFCA